MKPSYNVGYWFGVEEHDVILLLLLLTGFLIMLQKDKVNKIHKFMNDSIFKVNIIAAVFFTLWIIYFQKVEDAVDKDDKQRRIKLRRSLFLGQLAIIIALCAAFDLVVLPFWVVWISSYYFDIN